jgi:hypothetical protein|tara:strand:- start:1094 stop:2305 length:1212 start_codon:yes stop_codon:yes gene_type:complete
MRFNEFKDYAKGKDKMPKAKLGRTKHPLKGKLVGEGLLYEADARIQHAEDIVFWEGSRGAARAIESLKSLEQGKHTDVTIKWDGSPAVIFGRDENGQFVFTDKSGFSAKGYDGKSKSPQDLEAMLKNRPGYAKNPEGYGPFVNNMKAVYSIYEQATPQDYRGFFKGDLLYFNTPTVKSGNFVFKPNIVTYSVKVDSAVGKQIAASQSGIVIHREVSAEGAEGPLQNGNIFLGNDLLVLPPVVTQQPPQIDDSSIKELQAIVSKNAAAIDAILDANMLQEQKVSDLPQIFYTYLNSKVDSGLSELAKGFTPWLVQSKVSKPKQQKIIDIINSNIPGFNAIWQIVAGVMQVKDNIINQLESQEADITASINGQKGGEGYVLAHPQGDIKLVPREFFSRANRAVQR